jgi:hypothetical protein
MAPRSRLHSSFKAKAALNKASSALQAETGKVRQIQPKGHNRSFPGMISYRSSMKAAPTMAVGRMAQSNNFKAEIPSSPNRETRID